jgi:hypothetical protein
MSPAAPAIYVDLDDVLCETARHFLVVLEREFGRRVAYEQLSDFDIGVSCGLMPRERDELYRLIHEPDELLRMAPIPQAIAALGEWAAAGCEIAIVTGRPPDTLEPTRVWLERASVPHHSLTLVDKYGRFTPDDRIAIGLEQLRTRRYALAIEDSLPMARFLAREMRVPVALLDCPWNRNGSLDPGVERVSVWVDVVRQAGRWLSTRPAGARSG